MLISSILLLLIITILAISMFRSFDVQEQIAGNIREKQRATTAAEEAEQYAEYWLTNNASTPAAPCTQLLNGNDGNAGQICQSTLQSLNVSPATAPDWQTGGWLINGTPVGVTYMPSSWDNLNLVNANNPTAGTYLQVPSFYIAYLGLCADGVGSCYQIDAVGYGGTTATVSVVESTYEISSGIVNRGGL